MTKHELSSPERANLLHWLLGFVAKNKNGRHTRLSPGVCAEAAVEFNVGVHQVSRLFSKYRKFGAEIAISKNRHLCGNKRADIDLEKLKSIDFHKRGTVRRADIHLGKQPKEIAEIIAEEISSPNQLTSIEICIVKCHWIMFCLLS